MASDAASPPRAPLPTACSRGRPGSCFGVGLGGRPGRPSRARPGRRRGRAAAPRWRWPRPPRRPAARAVVAALDRLAAVPEGGADRAAATRLAWAIDRLLALDDARLALTPGLAGARGAARRGGGRGAARRRPAPRPQALLGPLREPHPAAARPDRRRAAARAAEAARRASAPRRSLGSLALQLAGWRLLFVGRGAAGAAADRRLGGADRRGRPREPLPAAARRADRHAERRLPAAPTSRGSPPARTAAPAQTAVLRVDLDRFKVLREALGQATCDEVLRIAGPAHPQGAARRRLRRPPRAGRLRGGRDRARRRQRRRDDRRPRAGGAGASPSRSAAARGGSPAASASRCSPTTGPTPSGRSPTPRSRSPRRRRRGPAACAISARTCGARSSGARRSSPSCCTGSTRGEIVPFFQPQVDLATGALRRLRGAGALAASRARPARAARPSSTSPSRPTSPSGSASWC